MAKKAVVIRFGGCGRKLARALLVNSARISDQVSVFDVLDIRDPMHFLQGVPIMFDRYTVSTCSPRRRRSPFLAFLALVLLGSPQSSSLRADTLRIVVGKDVYSVSDLIRLDRYRQGRSKLLREINWERSQIDASRGRQRIAAEDLSRYVKGLTNLYRLLRSEEDKALYGETNEFEVLKKHAMGVRRVSEEISLILTAFPDLVDVMAPQMRTVREVKHRIKSLRFRAKREGRIAEDVGLDWVAGDRTRSLATLLSQLDQKPADDVDSNSAVRVALLEFGSLAYEPLKKIASFCDRPYNVEEFETDVGEALRKSSERNLFLLQYLRVRFGVRCGVPDTWNSTRAAFRTIPVFSEALFDVSKDVTEVVKKLRDLQDLPGNMRLDGPTRRRIVRYVVEALTPQLEAEISLRSDGVGSDHLRSFLPSDADSQVEEILQQRTPSEILRRFRKVFLTILAVRTHNSDLSSRYNSGQSIPWGELLK
jgi:hypothetical protein